MPKQQINITDPGSDRLVDAFGKVNNNDTELYNHLGSRNGHPLATPTLPGFESAADKAKQDGVSAQAKHFTQFKPTAYLVSAIALAAGAMYTSGDVRGTTGVPADAVGVWLHVYGKSTDAAIWADLYVDSADTTPDGFSGRLKAPTASPASIVIPVTLGTGLNAGKFKLVAQANVGLTAVYAWAIGYWR